MLYTNSVLNVTQNGYLYLDAICCRPEVDGDVICSPKVKTMIGQMVVNFEVNSSSSFRDFQKEIHFVTVMSTAAVWICCL